MCSPARPPACLMPATHLLTYVLTCSPTYLPDACHIPAYLCAHLLAHLPACLPAYLPAHLPADTRIAQGVLRAVPGATQPWLLLRHAAHCHLTQHLRLPSTAGSPPCEEWCMVLCGGGVTKQGSVGHSHICPSGIHMGIRHTHGDQAAVLIQQRDMGIRLLSRERMALSAVRNVCRS